MPAPRVAVFFYGSYMNLRVLGEVDLVPDGVETASVRGFDVVIAPRANLVRADGGEVHGIVARASHAELDRLYAHARDVLGETYLPEAVVARTRGGADLPALCYISHDMTPRPAEAAYVERIVVAARAHGLPADYVARLARFAPTAGDPGVIVP